MALVKCPECGQAISEEAKNCVHCGVELAEEAPAKVETKCRECFCVLSESDEVCPNCGCPAPKETVVVIEPQQGEVTTIAVSSKNKKIVTYTAIVVLICAVVAVGIFAMNRAEAKKEYNEYIDKLVQAQTLMISSATKAEALCDLTSKVWGNAIYKNSDIATDKYTKYKGKWVGDFNSALQSLFRAEETQTMLSEIRVDQAEIETLIKTMQTPPSDLEKCYETVSELYDSYEKLTELAANPSGNYAGFSASKNVAVDDFLSNFKKLGVQIPEKR